MRAWWHSYGVPTISLRYFNVYGPGQDPTGGYAAVIPRFVTSCLAGTAPVIYGDGEQTRDFTYVADVVEATLLAARAPEPARGRVMNIGSGREPIAILELLRLISRISGTAPSPRFEPAREGDIRHTHADISLARSLIGYDPQVPLEEGVRRTVAWFSARG
jgi:nucleoside-diphosphate-sugar epimerase